MQNLSEYEQRSLQRLGEAIHEGKWSNAGLVQLIELAGTYLNAQSIADYAKAHGMSYNGAKKCRAVFSLLNHKFVIDND
jgi:hypothetical protein